MFETPTAGLGQRKHKHGRAAKRGSATVVQEQPKPFADSLERLLDVADHLLDPRDALEMFPSALGKCQQADSLGNADGNSTNVAPAGCYP